MQKHKLDKILPSALAACARAGIITARLGTNQTRFSEKGPISENLIYVTTKCRFE